MNPYLTMAAVIFTVVAAAWWIRRSVLAALRPRGREDALSLLQNQITAGSQQTAQQIEALRNGLQALTAQVYGALSETNKTVGGAAGQRHTRDQRRQAAARAVGRIVPAPHGPRKDISSLQEILAAAQASRLPGELFLSDLLAQILPAPHYEMQHRFKSGEAVDAVVILRSGLVPIDAKFPLENFRRSVSAPNEEEKKAARKAFLRDVKGHVDDISAKYIRMDEGTFDFALMYIPAENVYYETIVKDDELGGEMSLFNYALKRRVIPVSPNSFYAYLQTILLGLRGMRVEEGARDMGGAVETLEGI